MSVVRARLRLPGVWPADRSCSGYFQWGEFYSRKSGSCAILRGGSKGWEGCDDSQDIWKLRTVRTSLPVTSAACGPRVSCSRGSLGVLGSQGCCSELGNSFPFSPLSVDGNVPQAVPLYLSPGAFKQWLQVQCQALTRGPGSRASWMA